MTFCYKDFADYIQKNYREKSVVEIGVGSDFRVFKELKKRNLDIKAVDIRPSTGDVIRDDVLNPDMGIYLGCGLIYSIRPPFELIHHIEKIAQNAGADLIIKPLSTDDTPPHGKLKNFKGAFFYKIKIS